MNSLLHSSQPTVVFVLVFLAALLLMWRVLLASSKKPAEKKPANWIDSSAESGSDVSDASLYSEAAQRVPDSASSPQHANSGRTEEPSLGASGSEDAPDPSGIVAEVCSLQSPVRENVEQSYRGRRVRWTLSVSAISEREGQGATHFVRMYPSGRSPYSCGVYFTANAAEFAVLQAAGKNVSFVVEGTIDKVEDRDIDLTDVRMLENAA